MGSLTLGAAFGAGFLSFLSPCVLPMLPTFLLLLAGSGTEKEQGRGGLLLNTLAFLGGFTLVFLTMGATATLVGQLVLQYWKVLEKLAGALLILLGLFLSGLWTPLFLLRDRRPFLQQKKQGVLGSFLLGAALLLTLGFQLLALRGKRLHGFCADPCAAQLLLHLPLVAFGIAALHMLPGRKRRAETQLIKMAQHVCMHRIVLRFRAKGDFAHRQRAVLRPLEDADPERVFKVYRELQFLHVQSSC